MLINVQAFPSHFCLDIRTWDLITHVEEEGQTANGSFGGK